MARLAEAGGSERSWAPACKKTFGSRSAMAYTEANANNQTRIIQTGDILLFSNVNKMVDTHTHLLKLS